MSCTGTSTFGGYPFEVTSESAKPKIGNLALTYTLNGDGSITDACVTYTPPSGHNSQTFAVTFTGTASPYSGSLTGEPLQNPWNVPQAGAFKYATFSFEPPIPPDFDGSLNGQASKDPLIADDSITWEADPGVGQELHHRRHHKAAHPGQE